MHTSPERGKTSSKEIERFSRSTRVHKEQRVEGIIAEPREERAECEAGDRFSESQRARFPIFADTPNSRENSRRAIMSLREKLKLILREHGLTITAVLTSLGLIISTLVTARLQAVPPQVALRLLLRTLTKSASGSRTNSKLSLDFSVDLRVKLPLRFQELSDQLSLVF